MKLLVECATNLGHRQTSFFSITQFTLPSLALFFDSAIAIKCFGVSISYLVVIGDLAPKIILALIPNAHFFILHSNFWITIAIILISPLTFSKRLDALKFTSAIALMSVFYLLSVILGYALFSQKMPAKINWSDIVWFKIDKKFLTTLPIFVFAFTCHQNVIHFIQF